MTENANHDSCLNFAGQSVSEADAKKIQAMLNEDCPDRPVSEGEAADAYRNLGEFIALLIRINERVGLVNLADPTQPFVRKNDE